MQFQLSMLLKKAQFNMKVFPIFCLLICFHFPQNLVMSRGFCKINEHRSDEGTYVISYDHDKNPSYTLVYEVLYRYAICQNFDIPELLPVSYALELEYLKFENSVLTIIPTNFFILTKVVNQLYLNKSFVEEIRPNGFNGVTSLKRLYLNENLMKKVSPGMFNSLHLLSFMNLSNNFIEFIEEYSFTGLNNLNHIDLHNNMLKRIFVNTFQACYRIKTVDLSHNHLSDISDIYFNDIPLLHLNLSFNNLADVDFSKFSQTIQNLSLHNNLLIRISNLSMLNELVHLDLSYNEITQLDSFEALGTNTSLQYFDVSYNYLLNLSVNNFKNYIELNTLLLQNNYLDKIPIGSFKDLRSLRKLNVSSNRISVLEHGTLSNLLELEVLDISNNELSYIDEAIFYNLQELTLLDISNNSIVGFNPDEILDYCPKLSLVILHRNQWNCKVLSKIVRVFLKKNVTVSKGNNNDVANVNGIGCFVENNNQEEDMMNKESLIMDTFDSSSRVLIEQFSKMFENFNSILNAFSSQLLLINQAFRVSASNKNFNTERFNSDFRNSSFYKFFTEGFPKTSFYHYISSLNGKNLTCGTVETDNPFNEMGSILDEERK